MPRPPRVASFRPHASVILVGMAAILAVGALGCGRRGPRPGTVQDEAMRAGLKPEHFVRETKDYFRDMDYNPVHGKRPTFTQAEIEGRNMWMVWTGGNDRLWDRLTVDSLGSFDLLIRCWSQRWSGSKGLDSDVNHGQRGRSENCIELHPIVWISR